MILLILINLILSILLLYILYSLKKLKLLNKKLFSRAWKFELFILTIYDEVSPERQLEIDNILNNIKLL